MSEPRGAWGRPRPSATATATAAANRTPQSRSSNASPNPTSNAPAKPAAPAAAAAAPAANVWAERASERSRSTSQKPSVPAASKDTAAEKEKSVAAPAPSAPAAERHVPVNGFNDVEVKQFLHRGPKFAPYTAADAGEGGGSGAKRRNMANGQSFFAQLTKQVAALSSPK